ncbi:MAG: cell wall metabolism sensor histidine kinase WalK, partial [Acidobacteria bacterium]|nr:cell wall metabolism sensor histidine kinase WalK [Acidobacteriota bacterium]
GGEIRVRLEERERKVRIGVSDSGIGILAADIPHVFDRLYRADPARSRRTGGLGLGLSLVKWVVESHGGTIRLESELDRGTLCEMEFPLVSAAAGQPALAD